MSAVLRVGVVGVGIMGADHAERLARRTAHAALVAVADPDEVRAKELATRHDGVRSDGDALELIAADDVDAVVLASPGFVHEEQVLACLAAGKPVLCEKPLTMDSESSLRIVQAERERTGVGSSRSGSCGGSTPSTPGCGRCSPVGRSGGRSCCTTCTATPRSRTPTSAPR